MGDDAKQAKLAGQVDRAKQAEALKSNLLLKEFFQRVEQAAIRTISTSEPDQADLRERAYYQLNAIQDLKLCFDATIHDGAAATKEIQRMIEEGKKKETGQ